MIEPVPSLNVISAVPLSVNLFTESPTLALAPVILDVTDGTVTVGAVTVTSWANVTVPSPLSI